MDSPNEIPGTKRSTPRTGKLIAASGTLGLQMAAIAADFAGVGTPQNYPPTVIGEMSRLFPVRGVS
jgi:hypothetical protein